jgi:hypothetical protein
MPLWDKVKQELDRAGRAAQDAIDDGKVRLDAFRARQLADKAAQALGYAVYRARQGGGELDTATYDRLSATLATHEAEASRLEAQFESGKHGDAADATSPAEPGTPGSTPGAASTGTASPPGAGSTGTAGSTGDTGSANAATEEFFSTPRTARPDEPPSPYTGPPGSSY